MASGIFPWWTVWTASAPNVVAPWGGRLARVIGYPLQAQGDRFFTCLADASPKLSIPEILGRNPDCWRSVITAVRGGFQKLFYLLCAIACSAAAIILVQQLMARQLPRQPPAPNISGDPEVCKRGLGAAERRGRWWLKCVDEIVDEGKGWRWRPLLWLLPPRNQTGSQRLIQFHQRYAELQMLWLPLLLTPSALVFERNTMHFCQAMIAARLITMAVLEGRLLSLTGCVLLVARSAALIVGQIWPLVAEAGPFLNGLGFGLLWTSPLAWGGQFLRLAAPGAAAGTMAALWYITLSMFSFLTLWTTVVPRRQVAIQWISLMSSSAAACHIWLFWPEVSSVHTASCEGCRLRDTDQCTPTRWSCLLREAGSGCLACAAMLTVQHAVESVQAVAGVALVGQGINGAWSGPLTLGSDAGWNLKDILHLERQLLLSLLLTGVLGAGLTGLASGTEHTIKQPEVVPRVTYDWFQGVSRHQRLSHKNDEERQCPRSAERRVFLKTQEAVGTVVNVSEEGFRLHPSVVTTDSLEGSKWKEAARQDFEDNFLAANRPAVIVREFDERRRQRLDSRLAAWFGTILMALGQFMYTWKPHSGPATAMLGCGFLFFGFGVTFVSLESLRVRDVGAAKQGVMRGLSSCFFLAALVPPWLSAVCWNRVTQYALVLIWCSVLLLLPGLVL